jgi:hypothetical protein
VAAVKLSGPLFDGRADAALKEGITAVRRQVAAQGEKLTRAAFSAAIRDNHGRFLNSVTTVSRTTTFSAGGYTMTVTADLDEDIVTTDLASYGPWLEGTGSRNQTTRFKGYHGFRIAGQELDGRARGIAEQALAPYTARMN